MTIMKPSFLAILAFISCAYLSFVHLDNTCFWDDEARAGIIGRNFLSTRRLTGWDGRNLLAYRNGTTLDENLRTVDPPLSFLVTAASFKVFGPSTWAGRIPFVIAGLTGLTIFAFLLRYDFGKDQWLWVYALGVLAFSVVFLLNIRQCRYYALSLLFSQLSFYAYRRCLAKEGIQWFIILSGSSILLFYSNFLVCAAFLLALGVYHLMFHRHDFGARGWGMLAAAVGLFALATVPYALHYSIWDRPDIPTREVWYLRKSNLLLWNFRELNLLGCLPWTVAVSLVCFLVPCWKKQVIPRTTVQWAVFSLGYVFFLALLSPQPTNVDTIADVRYLLPAVPFLAGLVGAFLWFVHQRMKIVALAIFAIIVSSNLLTLTPFNMNFRWLLPAYVREVHTVYPTSYGAVVNFLAKNAGEDDLIYASPQYCNYPLMFYLGQKLRFCCLLDYRTPLSEETVRKLDAPLFIEEHYPDWFVAFGSHRAASQLLDYFSRRHNEDGTVTRFSYRLAKTLDVYWFDTSRPELPWHSFGPKTDFDQRVEAVYIFQRCQHDNTGQHLDAVSDSQGKA